jgi:hypothetical protein
MKLFTLLTYLITLLVYTLSRRIKKALTKMNCPIDQIEIYFVNDSTVKTDVEGCGVINLSNLHIKMLKLVDIPEHIPEQLQHENIHVIEFRVDRKYRKVRIYGRETKILLQKESGNDKDMFMKSVYIKFTSWFLSGLSQFYDSYASEEFIHIDKVEQGKIISEVEKIAHQIVEVETIYDKGSEMSDLILNCHMFLEVRKLEVNFEGYEEARLIQGRKELQVMIEFTNGRNQVGDFIPTTYKTTVNLMKNDCDSLFRIMENDSKKKKFK